MARSWFKILVIIVLILLIGLLIAASVFFAQIGQTKIVTSTTGWIMFALCILFMILLIIIIIVAFWKASRTSKTVKMQYSRILPESTSESVSNNPSKELITVNTSTMKENRCVETQMDESIPE